MELPVQVNAERRFGGVARLYGQACRSGEGAAILPRPLAIEQALGISTQEKLTTEFYQSAQIYDSTRMCCLYFQSFTENKICFFSGFDRQQADQLFAAMLLVE